MLKLGAKEFKIAKFAGFSFLISLTAWAKPALKQRYEQLQYPALPSEISERATSTARGVKKVSPVVKTDGAIAKDWALSAIGFFDLLSPSFSMTRVGAAECGTPITVAVVDTGIDYTHPDLKDLVWTNSGESGPWEPPVELRSQITCRDKSCNGIDDDKNGFIDDVVGWDFVHDVPLPYDNHGHGTHIAGIVASTANAGLAPGTNCQRVQIMPLKYYDNSGAGFNNLANTVRAIQYAVKAGADIINYSGGGSDPAASERAAIEDAHKKGILFIAAAGNDGHSNDQIPYYPASYGLENIIGVASLNKQNQLLPSSNFGKTVQVAAPGLSILSTLPEGKFGTMSGTSQATAFVTGTAALLASQMKSKSGDDYKQVRAWILDGVKPLKGNEKNTLLSAGILSLPKTILAQRDSLKKAPKVVPPLAASQDLAARPAFQPKKNYR